MDLRRLSHGRWLLGLFAVIVPLFTLCGCQKDEITSYQVPKSEPLAALAARRVPYRLVVYIVEHGKSMWVFKLLGPEKQVTPFVGDFDAFMESVKVTDEEGKPIHWQRPETWSELPGTQFRHATLVIDPKTAAQEISVTRMDKTDEAGLLANINRWRTQQLGLSAISKGQVGEVTKELKINGDEAKRIEMVGTPVSAPRMAPMAEAVPKVEPKKAGLKYNTPEGWKEQPPDAGGFRAAGFKWKKATKRHS